MMKLILSVFILIFSYDLSAFDKLPDIEIKQIEQGVFLHKSYREVKGYGLVSSNGLIVVEKNQAFIIDTPWSEKDTELLLAWIDNNNYQLRGSISTHSHEDRTAGIALLKKNHISTYAPRLTNKILTSTGKAAAEHALDFQGEEHLSVIGQANTFLSGAVQTFYPGAGHAVDNIVVWLPNVNLLFAGCLVRSLTSKSLGYTGEADIAQWPISVKKLQHQFPDIKYVVPGHGSVGDSQLLVHTIKLAQGALQHH
jgi:glyoxylase-like metal-dependent hydrolase (beta-lactamase superfamily II)